MSKTTGLQTSVDFTVNIKFEIDSKDGDGEYYIVFTPGRNYVGCVYQLDATGNMIQTPTHYIHHNTGISYTVANDTLMTDDFFQWRILDYKVEMFNIGSSKFVAGSYEMFDLHNNPTPKYFDIHPINDGMNSVILYHNHEYFDKIVNQNRAQFQNYKTGHVKDLKKFELTETSQYHPMKTTLEEYYIKNKKLEAEYSGSNVYVDRHHDFKFCNKILMLDVPIHQHILIDIQINYETVSDSFEHMRYKEANQTNDDIHMQDVNTTSIGNQTSNSGAFVSPASNIATPSPTKRIRTNDGGGVATPVNLFSVDEATAIHKNARSPDKGRKRAPDVEGLGETLGDDTKAIVTENKDGILHMIWEVVDKIEEGDDASLESKLGKIPRDSFIRNFAEDYAQLLIDDEGTENNDYHDIENFMDDNNTTFWDELANFARGFMQEIGDMDASAESFKDAFTDAMDHNQSEFVRRHVDAITKRKQMNKARNRKKKQDTIDDLLDNFQYAKTGAVLDSSSSSSSSDSFYSSHSSDDDYLNLSNTLNERLYQQITRSEI